MKKFVEKEPNELEPTNLPATQAPARGRQSPVGQGPHHAGVMRPCRRLAEPSPPNRGARGRSCACAGRGSTAAARDTRAQRDGRRGPAEWPARLRVAPPRVAQSGAASVRTFACRVWRRFDESNGVRFKYLAFLHRFFLSRSAL